MKGWEIEGGNKKENRGNGNTKGGFCMSCEHESCLS